MQIRPVIVVALLAAAACNKAGPVADNAVAPPANVIGDAGATGLAAPDNAAAAEAHDEAMAPSATDVMHWSADFNGNGIHFGPPGAPPVLSIACERMPAIHLVITRGAAAPEGGKGTLSLTGAGHVASLPIAATGDGTERSWRAEAAGDIRAAFERTFAPGGTVQFTLAGVPDLVVPADPLVAQLFARCR